LILLVSTNIFPHIISVYSLDNQNQNNIKDQGKQIAVGKDNGTNLTLYPIGYGLPGESKQIAVGNDKDGRLVLFNIEIHGNVTGYKYQLTPGGGNWSNWIGLGGESKQIAVGNDKDGRLVLFSIGIHGNVPGYKYQLTPGGGNWSNW